MPVKRARSMPSLTKSFRRELRAPSPRSTGRTGISAFAETTIRLSLGLSQLELRSRTRLINGFEVIDDISAYDQWIAVLEEAATFLRSEKARFENEIATATCSGCRHAL